MYIVDNCLHCALYQESSSHNRMCDDGKKRDWFGTEIIRFLSGSWFVHACPQLITATRDYANKARDPLRGLAILRDRYFPARTKRWTNVGLLLAHRLRRWPNIKPTLVQRPATVGLGFSNPRKRRIYFCWWTSEVDRPGVKTRVNQPSTPQSVPSGSARWPWPWPTFARTPSEHGTSNPCLVNAGPASATLAQYEARTSRGFGGGFRSIILCCFTNLRGASIMASLHRQVFKINPPEDVDLMISSHVTHQRAAAARHVIA